MMHATEMKKIVDNYFIAMEEAKKQEAENWIEKTLEPRMKERAESGQNFCYIKFPASCVKYVKQIVMDAGYRVEELKNDQYHIEW